MKKKVLIVVFVFLLIIILFGCLNYRILSRRAIIQNIKYRNKTFELYIIGHGILATPSINIGIFSKFDKRFIKDNIFPAYAKDSQKINMELKETDGIFHLEAYHYLLTKEIYLQQNNIDGLKIVYTPVDDNYEFLGYDK
jgi:hypothetical protein